MNSRLSMENASPLKPVLEPIGKPYAPWPAGSSMVAPEPEERLYAVGGGFGRRRRRGGASGSCGAALPSVGPELMGSQSP